MVTWSAFAAWMKAHDLPETACLRIELVPTAGSPAPEAAIYLRATVLKLDDAGRMVGRRFSDKTDPDAPGLLTEVLVRPLVAFPGDTPTEPAA